MKKLIILFISLISVGIYLLAQAPANAGSTSDAKQTTSAELSDTGATDIQTKLIDDFEDAGSWQGQMPRDLGIIRVMAREGGPGEIKAADKEKNKICLGAKINFFKTGASWFSLAPPREIAVPGLTKSLEIWACGRNFKHELQAIIRDFNGKLRYTSFGELNFPGWQAMNAQIPTSVVQDNYKLWSEDNPRGIKFVSLLINCAQDETVGQYYLYVDQLSAKTDVFLEDPKNRDVNDMRDNW